LQGLAASMRILSLRSQATPPEIAAALGSGWETCLFVERLHLVDNEPIALGRSFLPEALRGLSRDEVESRPAYALLAENVGQNLERASVTVGAQSADRELESALLVPRGAALLVMERTSYFADDVPAERSIFYVRPERYRFAVNSFFQQADRGRSG
jgi:GntR family transcriptional regulator